MKGGGKRGRERQRRRDTAQAQEGNLDRTGPEWDSRVQEDGKDDIRLGQTDSRTNALLVFTLWWRQRRRQRRAHRMKRAVSIVPFESSHWCKARNKVSEVAWELQG